MAARDAVVERSDGWGYRPPASAGSRAPAVRCHRLRRLARLRQQEAEDVVAVRQAGAELDDGGVVGGQLLLDRLRPAELGLRLRWLARLRQQDAEALMAERQGAAELGDGGVIGGQLLADLERPAVLDFRVRRSFRSPPARCRSG